MAAVQFTTEVVNVKSVGLAISAAHAHQVFHMYGLLGKPGLQVCSYLNGAHPLIS